MTEPISETSQNPEIEHFSNIRIIDNEGIRRGNQVIDIDADPVKIGDYILGKVKQVYPQFLSTAEERLQGLTISLGARNEKELYEQEIKSIWKDDHIPGIAIPEKIDLSDRTLGIYFPHPKHPYLFLNTSKLGKDQWLINQWDHELAHFIDVLDPSHPDSILRTLKVMGAAIGIDTSLSIIAITTGQLLVSLAKKEAMTRREFVLGALRKAPFALLLLGVGPYFSSQLFPGNEERAEEIKGAYPTDKQTFDQMFKIKIQS